MPVFNRLWDAVKLPQFENTRLQVHADAFGSSRSQVNTLGKLGEAIQIASGVESNTFSLSWISTDTTGEEQHNLRKYFSSGEPYEIEAPEFRLPKIQASVLDIEVSEDYKTTTVLFQARYGIGIEENRYLIQERYYPWDWTASDRVIETIYGNPFFETKIEVEVFVYGEGYEDRGNLGTGIFKPGVPISLTGFNVAINPRVTKTINFVVGAQDDNGRWNLTQNRNSIVLDTSRLLLGAGYFDPATTSFFRILPDEVWSINVAPISNPIQSPNPGIGWGVRVYEVSPGIEAY